MSWTCVSVRIIGEASESEILLNEVSDRVVSDAMTVGLQGWGIAILDLPGLKVRKHDRMKDYYQIFVRK